MNANGLKKHRSLGHIYIAMVHRIKVNVCWVIMSYMKMNDLQVYEIPMQVYTYDGATWWFSPTNHVHFLNATTSSSKRRFNLFTFLTRNIHIYYWIFFLKKTTFTRRALIIFFFYKNNRHCLTKSCRGLIGMMMHRWLNDLGRFTMWDELINKRSNNGL